MIEFQNLIDLLIFLHHKLTLKGQPILGTDKYPMTPLKLVFLINMAVEIAIQGIKESIVELVNSQKEKTGFKPKMY